jgi:DNA-binding HxlR family transcriptional regulator
VGIIGRLLDDLAIVQQAAIRPISAERARVKRLDCSAQARYAGGQMANRAASSRATEPVCSIERCLQSLSDRWSFLIMRESLLDGVTRFADFERRLGIAPNILSHRLDRLVTAGLLAQRFYQEPGSRRRRSYHPTPAGRDLALPLAALQQWADEHDPPAGGPTVVRRSADGRAVRVAVVDEAQTLVPVDRLVFHKTPTHPLHDSAT